MDVHLSASAATAACSPHGVKPGITHKKIRERIKHAWNHIPIKSAQYAMLEKEKVVMGRHTPLEYLLILCLLRRNEMDRDLNMIEKIYTACLELCHVNDITVPLGQKTCNEISSIISEYDKNREIFESTCIAQLKVTHEH